MFSLNLLRRLERHNVSRKDEATRTKRVRARRNPVGVQALEGRHLLSTAEFMLVGDGTIVTGEANNPLAPKGSFELNSFIWGVSNPATVGGASSGTPSAPNFSITKPLDRASIGLFAATTSGRLFSSAEVLVVNTGATETKLLEYDFTNVYVTSAQLSGSGERPTESDTFAFQKVTINYWLTNPDGSQTEYSAAYDFRTRRLSNTSTSSTAVDASGKLHKTAGAHAAHLVNGSHKASAVAHRLATDKVSRTKFSKKHRLSFATVDR